MTVNISRAASGGVFNGLFGNPVKERHVSEQYRTHIAQVLNDHPKEREWLRNQLTAGARLYCAGCGYDSPTCHARILVQELKKISP